MSDESVGMARVERAVYAVGAAVVLVFSIEALEAVGLTIYNALAPSGHPTPSTETLTTWSVQILVGIVFFLGGLTLLYLASKAHRRARAPPTSPA